MTVPHESRSRVLVATRVAVPPQRAFDAFTREIDRWWRPNGLFQFTNDPAGTLCFVEEDSLRRLVYTASDDRTFEVGRVLNWTPPDGFAVTWREASFPPGIVTELRVGFAEVTPGITRVTVEHFGWDQLEQAHAARHGFPLDIFQMRLAEWWQSLLGGLQERLTS